MQTIISALLLLALLFSLASIADAGAREKIAAGGGGGNSGFITQKTYLTDPQDVLEYLVYVNESQRGYVGQWSYVVMSQPDPLTNEEGFWVFHTLPDRD